MEMPFEVCLERNTGIGTVPEDVLCRMHESYQRPTELPMLAVMSCRSAGPEEAGTRSLRQPTTTFLPLVIKNGNRAAHTNERRWRIPPRPQWTGLPAPNTVKWAE